MSISSVRSEVIAAERLTWTGVFSVADSGIARQHPAESASWIWVDRWSPKEAQVVRFTRYIECAETVTIHLHLSADQRFQLRISGELIARGPDRSDVEHWSVATYQVTLPAGRHQVEVLVWWLPLKIAPIAQMTWRGGFLLAAEDEWDAELSTGKADWQAEDISDAVSFGQNERLGFHKVGPAFCFDMKQWMAASNTTKVKVVRGDVWEGNLWGVPAEGWHLYPSTLAEQKNDVCSGGRVRRCQPAALESSVEACLRKGVSFEVPPQTTLEFLWDFEEYRCGYPDVELCGDEGASLRFEWAEALYAPEGEQPVHSETPKKNRSEIEGKEFLGFGDTWCLAPGLQELPALWWRSGRYARIRIQTSEEAITIRKIGLRETGYPLDFEGGIECDDSEWMKCQPLLQRSMSMSAHEIWVDCPYYEQLSYIGDDVTELGALVACRDDRLTRHCLRLFDWSRDTNGMPSGRYPSHSKMVSTTYGLLYVKLLHDYAMWRGDAAFIRERLTGARSIVEVAFAQVGEDGLLHETPGWPFIDWVDTWLAGCGPGVREGDSSIVNLHLYLALKCLATMERAYGEVALAVRAQTLFEELGCAILRTFWSDERNLMADTSQQDSFSEHAQAIAISAGLLQGDAAKNCVQAWVADRNHLAPASIYFSFYVLDAFYLSRAEDAFHDSLNFWKALPAKGFYTTPEQPEPSRSDCHGWGAHPIYHSIASIAGIRLTSPGFQTLDIDPMLGSMRQLSVKLVRPNGFIEMSLDLNQRQAENLLPKEVRGQFRLAGLGIDKPLISGQNQIRW